MPPPTKWPEALCFWVVRPSVRPSARPSVRPSVRTYVRPSVRPSVPFCLCRYLKNREAVLHQTWYEGISWGDDTLGGFLRSQGQRSKVTGYFVLIWSSVWHTMRHECVTWCGGRA